MVAQGMAFVPEAPSRTALSVLRLGPCRAAEATLLLLPHPKRSLRRPNRTLQQQHGGVCGLDQKSLYECLQQQQGNASACQYYFDALKTCQENAQWSQQASILYKFNLKKIQHQPNKTYNTIFCICFQK